MPFPTGMFELREVPEWGGGYGIFAKKDIPQGTVYWRFRAPEDAETDSWENLGPSPGPNELFTVEELQTAGKEGTRPDLPAILWGCFCHVPTRLVIHLNDGCQFTNHSFDPAAVNGGGLWSKDPQDEYAEAVKDIKAGEQLLEDYGVFQDFETPGFAQLLKTYCPVRYEFERTVKIKHGVTLPETVVVAVSPPVSHTVSPPASLTVTVEAA